MRRHATIEKGGVQYTLLDIDPVLLEHDMGMYYEEGPEPRIVEIIEREA